MNDEEIMDARANLKELHDGKPYNIQRRNYATQLGRSGFYMYVSELCSENENMRPIICFMLTKN